MDFAKLPIGFAMALAENTPALEKFGQISESERETFISRAKGARSRKEMKQIVSSITATGKM